MCLVHTKSAPPPQTTPRPVLVASIVRVRLDPPRARRREDDSFMDFELSEDQAAFQAVARDFARDVLLPQAAESDEHKIFPVAVLRAAAALGFAGIYVAEEFGGSGLSRLDAALIFEELAAADPSTAAYLSIHNMASWMIDRFGTVEQRARFLPSLMTMAHFASYCLT